MTQIEIQEQQQQQLATENDSKRILIVDDDRLILIALEETLKREGHEIIKAMNGEQAVEILRHQSVALIVCDQRMPGISGIEVLNRPNPLPRYCSHSINGQ